MSNLGRVIVTGAMRTHVVKAQADFRSGRFCGNLSPVQPTDLMVYCVGDDVPNGARRVYHSEVHGFFVKIAKKRRSVNFMEILALLANNASFANVYLPPWKEMKR